jgi:hypothetical protein
MIQGLKEDASFIPELSRDQVSLVYDFIEKTTKPRQRERLSVDDCLRHPFLTY